MVCGRRNSRLETISRRRLIRFIVVGGCRLFGCFVVAIKVIVVFAVAMFDAIIKLVAIVLETVSNAFVIVAVIVQM